MAEPAWTACRCRPNGFPGSPSTSRSTTSPSRRRNAAARLRSKAPRETPREHRQGAVPVALVAAQARIGEGERRAEASRARRGPLGRGGDDREAGAGCAETRAAAGRFAPGARLGVQGFPAPGGGREAAPDRAAKALPRSAFQRDRRARRLYRRLFEARSDPGGDAENPRAREAPALRRREGKRGDDPRGGEG